MRHSDNLLTFPRTLVKSFLKGLFTSSPCLSDFNNNNKKKPIEIKCMALKKIHHTDAQKIMARQKEDARWCTQADAGSAERGGPAHRGGHHPNQEPSGCTSYFSNLQDVAKIWGGIVNCGGGHVIQVEDAGGVAKQLGGSSGWSWHTPADLQSFWSQDSSNHLKWVISPTDEMASQQFHFLGTSPPYQESCYSI